MDGLEWESDFTYSAQLPEGFRRTRLIQATTDTVFFDEVDEPVKGGEGKEESIFMFMKYFIDEILKVGHSFYYAEVGFLMSPFCMAF